MTETPTQTRFIEKNNTFPVGRVIIARAIEHTDEILIRVRINLYFAVLSNITPITNDPTTPVKIKIPPNRALSPEEYP